MYKFIATNNNNYKYIPEDNTRNSYNYIMKELKKPEHYQTNSIDVIDLCNEYNINFNLGNVIKYCCRAGKKENESTLKDLKKAKDYLDRQIKYLESK